jgi:hypothetical protein
LEGSINQTKENTAMPSRQLQIALLLTGLSVCLTSGAFGQSTFNVVPAPKGAGALAAAASSSPKDIWAVGASAIHFDGTGWTAFPEAGNQAETCVNGVCTSSTSTLTGVADISPNNAWAVGSITTLTVTESPLSFNETTQAVIQHWDGTAWSVFPGATFAAGDAAAFFGITATSASDVWVVGNLLSNGNTLLNFLFEHWNGNTWTPTVIPVSSPEGAFLMAISADAADDVWAVGFKGPENDDSHTLVLHFDGTSWKEAPSPSVGQGASQLNAVAAINPKDVWAVGFSTPEPPPALAARLTLTEHWNGATWDVVSSPNVGPTTVNQSNVLYGVTAASSTDIWAFGSSFAADGSGHQSTLLMNWTGNSWTLTPSPDPTLGNFLDDILFAGVAHTPSDVWLVGSEDVSVTGGGFEALLLHSAPATGSN